MPILLAAEGTPPDTYAEKPRSGRKTDSSPTLSLHRIVTVRSERGILAPKHDARSARTVNSLRPQFGKIIDHR